MNRNWQAFLATRELKSAASKGFPDFFYGNRRTSSLHASNLYSILQVGGEDAATFLQGQTTCDVIGLPARQVSPGAICNPKGRVLTTFLVYKHEDSYRLILPESLISRIEKKLRMYVLRSKVVIENISDSCAIFGISCECLPNHIKQYSSHSDNAHYPLIEAKNGQILKTGATLWLYIGAPDDAELQWHRFVEQDGFAEAAEEVWNLLCILNGIPSITPETSEEFVPQMINLDALGGISFKKGCYTGQEIVARMHYLGKLKRRMVLAAYESEQLPNPGAPVYVSGSEQSVGQIVSAAWFRKPEIRVLLVLQIEHFESDSIHVADTPTSPFRILDLPYNSGHAGN